MTNRVWRSFVWRRDCELGGQLWLQWPTTEPPRVTGSSGRPVCRRRMVGQEAGPGDRPLALIVRRRLMTKSHFAWIRRTSSSGVPPSVGLMRRRFAMPCSSFRVSSTARVAWAHSSARDRRSTDLPDRGSTTACPPTSTRRAHRSVYLPVLRDPLARRPRPVRFRRAEPGDRRPRDHKCPAPGPLLDEQSVHASTSQRLGRSFDARS